MSFVQIEGLSVSYGKVLAVRDVSFEIPQGEVFGFIGPNGAGKSTTIKVLATLLKPDSGRVRIDGIDVPKYPMAIRRRIGYMPDFFGVYEDLSASEYLHFYAAAYQIPRSQRGNTIGDVLALTDLTEKAQAPVDSLSRGMKQRLALARVLLHDPDLLLLDEPASGLDPRARIELMEILRALRQMGKTIFISSHILTELAELCDSVTIIDRGSTRYSGPMDELLQRNAEQPTYKLKLESPANGLIDSLMTSEGVLEVTPLDDPRELRIVCKSRALDANTLLRRILEHNVQVVSFGEDQRHLNEAFMHLTQEGVRS